MCVLLNTLMTVRTVNLSHDAYAALTSAKKEGESFSDVVRRLTGTHRSLMEFAGAWKDVPEEKMRAYRDWLAISDRASKRKIRELAHRAKG